MEAVLKTTQAEFREQTLQGIKLEVMLRPFTAMVKVCFRHQRSSLPLHMNDVCLYCKIFN